MSLYAPEPDPGPDLTEYRAAWREEWKRQLAALPQELQDDMKLNELHPAFEKLFDSVERSLAERGIKKG